MLKKCLILLLPEAILNQGDLNFFLATTECIGEKHWIQSDLACQLDPMPSKNKVNYKKKNIFSD